MSDKSKLTPSGLAALLCARICHDLVSPVSALGTALNVLDDKDNEDMHEDALDLVRDSSRQAAAKLEFLRVSLGAAGSAPGMMDTRHLGELTRNMYQDNKAEIDWAVDMPELEKTASRLLLNMVMMGVMAVPFGGKVRVEATGSDNQSRLRVVSTGRKARLDEMTERTLSGKAPDDGFDGRSVQPFYSGLMAREAGGRIEARAEEERVEFTALMPTG